MAMTKINDKNQWQKSMTMAMAKINDNGNGKNQSQKSMTMAMAKINGKNQWQKSMAKINGKNQ